METYKPYRVEKGMHHQAVSDGYDTYQEAVVEAVKKVKENHDTYHVHKVLAVVDPVLAEPSVRHLAKEIT